jgi:hypothetical protein
MVAGKPDFIAQQYLNMTSNCFRDCFAVRGNFDKRLTKLPTTSLLLVHGRNLVIRALRRPIGASREKSRSVPSYVKKECKVEQLELMRISLPLGLLSLFTVSCNSFYVPGWSPHTYRVGDAVPLFLNKVSSERTHLPYAYSELPGVCKPTTAQRVSLNLGEILRGDHILVLRGADCY